MLEERFTLENNSAYTVELMDERHLEEVARIEQESFSEPWSLNALKNTLGDEKYRFYCMVDNRHLKTVGYVGVIVVCGEGEIVSVATDRELRGNGLGDSVLKEVMRREKERGTERLYLEVRESNIAAIRLYEKNGFVKDGVRKNFYRKPTEDAWLMSKELC